MGRRVSVVQQTSSGSSTLTKDPFEQPCFSHFGGYYSNAKGWFTLDHNLNMSNHMTGANGGYNSWTCDNNSYSTEFSNTFASSSWIQSQGNASSNSSYPCLNTFVGYLGHMGMIGSSNSGGNPTPWIVGSDNGYSRRSYAFRDVGTLPGETHQDYAIFCEFGGNFRVCRRNANLYYMGQQYGRLPVTDIPNGWSSQMYGTCSYNRKRNKLVFMETDDGFNFQPFVWSNVPNLRSYAASDNWYQGVTESSSAISNSNRPLDQYFANTSNRSSTNYYGQASGKPTNQTTEDRRRGQLVLCDNDRLVMFQMIPSYGSWVTRWNSPTVDGNGNNTGALRDMSWTTSYGIDQGTYYGSRFTQTSDGRYIAMYCPAYYYGSGLMCAITRVSDGKTLYTNWQSSDNSIVPIPIGKSNFLMCSSSNTDSGHGVKFIQFNCDYRFGNSNDNTDPGMINNYDDPTRYCFDHAYYTTSYPAYIPAMYDTSLFNTETSDVKDGYDPMSTS
tara:strand:+ start:99 stop:1592 length:1494 start_codon:yes stop_codon:yes gene_type:complete